MTIHEHIFVAIKHGLMSPIVNSVFYLSFCFLSLHPAANAQVICRAMDSLGSAYPVFLSAGMDYEDPDCEHLDFGPHVTQGYDSTLYKNVFIFHSHITEDSDRCQVQDRVRIEVKGGPGTDAELQHLENDTSYYRWKFRIAKDFIGSASFNHIYQNKAKGGNDDAFPLLTLTLRMDRLELRHNAGSTGESLGVLAQVSIDQLRGQWMEAYCMQVHGEKGVLEFSIRSMDTGLKILEHKQNNIDLWRVGAEYNRPKWGMYRLKNVTLRDEEIRIADFCISEIDSSLCPSDAILVTDTIAPTIPLDLRQGRTFVRSVELHWHASYDAFGISHYELIRDDVIIQILTDTTTIVDSLEPGGTYVFNLRAVDEAGNKSNLTNTLSVTTYEADALPQSVTDPTPADLDMNVHTDVIIQWDQPDNTEAYRIYLGKNTDPALVRTQTENRLDTILEPNTMYYWRIGSLNSNGETSSTLWSFITSEANPDAPWLVYRADDKPHMETNFYLLDESPQNPLRDELIADPNGSANSLYVYRSDANDKFRWRHNFLASDSAITIVARLQAANHQVSGISHFEIRMNGWREKVRINDRTVKLERSDDLEREHGLDLINEMHILRIISDGKNTTVYLNESLTPLISGVSNTIAAGNYFEWGKSGVTDYGGIVDWIVIDKSGAYPPQEGTPLPEDLFLSSIATLSDLRIDDQTIPGFSPKVTQYSIEVPESDLPMLSWNTTSPLAMVEATNSMIGTNYITDIEVIAQDNYTKMSYTIDFIGSSSIYDLENTPIQVFPNPAKEVLYVVITDGSEMTAKILSIDGTIILDNLMLDSTDEIDLSSITAGSYILSISNQEKQNLKYKFNKI